MAQEENKGLSALQWLGLAILLGILAKIGYDAIQRMIEKNKLLDKARTQNANSQENAVPPTINESQAESIATLIDKSGGEYTWDSEDKLMSAIKMIKNDSDFDMVNNAFGVRSEYVSLLTTNDMNMSQFINFAHSSSIQKVNDYFKQAGLTKSI